MPKTHLKVARIGNSRGVRLPAGTLERYGIGEQVIMEERSDGILLRPETMGPQKLSWEDTAAEMSQAGEDWSDWDRASSDGLEAARWQGSGKRVAEGSRAYNGARKRKPRKR